MTCCDLLAIQWSANGRFWPFAAPGDGAVEVRVPPNNGLQVDAPRAARA